MAVTFKLRNDLMKEFNTLYESAKKSSYANNEMVKALVDGVQGYNAYVKNNADVLIPALVGCICLESGANPAVLNRSAYQKGGKNNDESLKGWGCDEGYTQWAKLEWKKEWINLYNKEKPSNFSELLSPDKYMTGYTIPNPEYTAPDGHIVKNTPYWKNNSLYAEAHDGHIAGLTKEEQMFLLSLYFNETFKKMSGEVDIAAATGRIYRRKAGTCRAAEGITDPVYKAYVISGVAYDFGYNKENHFLQSLAVALAYARTGIKDLNVEGFDPDPGDYVDLAVARKEYAESKKSAPKFIKGRWTVPDYSGYDKYLLSLNGSYDANDLPPWTPSVNTSPTSVPGNYLASTDSPPKTNNTVTNLASASVASKRSDRPLDAGNSRKAEFQGLQNTLTNNAPVMGRNIMITSEMFAANILKKEQEAKTGPTINPTKIDTKKETT